MKALLPLALLLALFAGCAEGFDPIASAGWQAGNAFGYTIEASAKFAFEGVLEGKPPESVVREDAFGPSPWIAYEVVNTQLRHGADPMYLTLANLGSMRFGVGGGNAEYDARTSHGLDAPLGFRQRDLQVLDTTVSRSGVSFSDGGDDYPLIRFPLTMGDKWSGMLDPDNEGSLSVRSEVLGMRSVQGPQGKVDAILIRHTAKLPSDFEKELRRDAAEDGATVHEVRAALTITIDVYFSPELRNIVLEHTRMKGDFYVSFTMDGKRGHFKAVEEWTVKESLSAASLGTKPELTVAQVLDLDAPLPIPRPGTVTLPTAGETRIVASPPRANAAVPADVMFLLAGDLPSGSTVTYRIDGPQGEVASGEGRSAEHRFEEPGLYEAVFTVEGQDGTQRHALPYAVDYEADAAISCGTVHVDLLTDCGKVSFPVGGSRAMLGLAVDASGIHLAGQLVITDAEGAEVLRTQAADDDHLVAVPTGSASPWTVTVEGPAGVLAGVDLSLRLRVDGGVDEEEGMDAFPAARWLEPVLRQARVSSDGTSPLWPPATSR